LLKSGANPKQLKLEITESLIMDNLDDTIAKMHAINQLGVGFSVDDFGTGYSSLSYLQRMPLDQLKIDQAFVRDLVEDNQDTAIIRIILALGESLGLTVIAEGVETDVQRDYLHK
jgi:EAL domain-containing protein (putative c-di-GMP-specific phosphodiesterase class I)